MDEKTFLHDISSPLTAVLLNIENALVVMEGQTFEESKECTQLLNDSLNHLKRSIHLIQDRREGKI